MNDNAGFRRAMQYSCSTTNPRTDNNADDGDELQSDAGAHNRPPSHDGLALFLSRYCISPLSAVQHTGTACVAGHETAHDKVQSTFNKDGLVSEEYRGAYYETKALREIWFKRSVIAVSNHRSLVKNHLPYFSIDNARVIYTKKGLNS